MRDDPSERVARADKEVLVEQCHEEVVDEGGDLRQGETELHPAVAALDGLGQTRAGRERGGERDINSGSLPEVNTTYMQMHNFTEQIL